MVIDAPGTHHAELIHTLSGASPSAGGNQGSCSRACIASGDIVIVFLSRDRSPIALTVQPGLELLNTYGRFLHEDMIGMPFGAKMPSKDGRGFVHLLRPSPELWTLALPHRTQILYTPDMSFIASHLGLSPGARLIEAGTGSGSFTHYAARCVARHHGQPRGLRWKSEAKGHAQTMREATHSEIGRDEQMPLNVSQPSSPSVSGTTSARLTTKLSGGEDENAEEDCISMQLTSCPDDDVAPRQGRVWSFEFHAVRAKKAYKEFLDHGLAPTVSLRHRNVIKSGFGLSNVADAVFLDLPAPWDAIPHAIEAMRRDVACRICCFSPCVEQVLKTLSILRNGSDSTQKDVLCGDQDQIQWTDIETYECLNRTHLSVWSGAGSSIPNESVDDILTRLQGVEERKGKRRAMQIEKAKKERLQRDGQEEGISNGSTLAQQRDGLETETTGEKRKRADEGGSDDRASVDADTAQQGNGRSAVLSRPYTEMRGHTSYLTFATLLPRDVVRRPDPALEREQEQLKRKVANMERARTRKTEQDSSASV